MTPQQRHKLDASLARRHRAEARFRLYGKLAIGLALAVLAYLFYTIITPGISGFIQHQVRVEITQTLVLQSGGNDQKLVAEALRAHFPAQSDAGARRSTAGLLSLSSSYLVHRELEGQSLPAMVWLPLSDPADQYLKGKDVPMLAATQREQLAALEASGDIRARFNTHFFSRGDSREPDLAGFAGSMVGSFFTLVICLGLSFVVGVMSAIYLEEFAPKNRITDLIEVNINNLAAVPSIIFGLLGLAVFLQFFGLPRSSALVGGLTLSLMILPVIIISARVSLKAVPPSIREGARGLGASPLQVVAHHVVPYAMPGMMTGAILGLARAIGETAPLLMIGMVAFVADVPRHFLDPATVMPVQIYIWAGSPELGFVEKTSTGIIVLLSVLMLMNAAAIWVRRKYEIKW